MRTDVPIPTQGQQPAPTDTAAPTGSSTSGAAQDEPVTAGTPATASSSSSQTQASTTSTADTSAASASAPPATAKSDTGPATGKFVALPQDIHCLLHDTQTTFGFHANGEMKTQLSSIKAITCQIKGPQQDVPLVGIQPNGTVLTKDFGRLKIAVKNQVDPVTSSGSIVLERIEIQSGKLKSFREFLLGK